MVEVTTQYPDSWDDIPVYDPLPSGGGSHIDGTGISRDLETCKAKDLVDEEFAVMGFATYESKEEPGQYFTYVEIMDESGARFKFSTSSKVLVGHLSERRNRGQIPFRTVLRMKESQKTKGRVYYAFD